MKKPVVALIGRPNVGKSTLFNRLVGKQISIIEDTPGVTRDRIYGTANFNDKPFHLIDTGGIEDSEDVFSSDIRVQAMLAIDEADVILFVVDGEEGLTSNDYLVRDIINKSNKKVIVVINKSDTRGYNQHKYDFYELGLEHYVSISAEQKDGVYDLLELITHDFKKFEEDIEDDIIRFSIIGRPNVGKSSLVNAIIGEEKAIVSDVAGTTRDAVDTPFIYHGNECIVIDTAGLRKKGKVYESIEKYSLIRSLRAIDRSNVCCLVINAEEGIIEHDKHIAGYALEAGKGLILVVNKWDLVEDKDQKMKEWLEDISTEFNFISYVPVIFLSALTTKRIHTLMPEIIKVYENCRREIPTSTINNVIMEAFHLNPPPSYKSKRLKIYFTSQVGTNPPKFDIQVNSKKLVHFSYERYLTNKIRESFNFKGTPIVLQFKNKGEETL